MSKVLGRLHQNSVHLFQKLSLSPISKMGSEFLELPDLSEVIIAELLGDFGGMSLGSLCIN